MHAYVRTYVCNYVCRRLSSICQQASKQASASASTNAHACICAMHAWTRADSNERSVVSEEACRKKWKRERERERERERRRRPMSACESFSLQHLSPGSRASLRAFRSCVCASRAHERRMGKGRRRVRDDEGIREADCDCLEIYSSSVAALG